MIKNVSFSLRLPDWVIWEEYFKAYYFIFNSLIQHMKYILNS
jgi:hypothetical protein